MSKYTKILIAAALIIVAAILISLIFKDNRVIFHS